MTDLNFWDWAALILAIAGAINWGLVGLLKINLVKAILGEGAAARFVYVLIGLSGAYLIYLATELTRK